MGLHGLYYNHITPHNVAAGHIHVGVDVTVEDAEQLMVATLAAVLNKHPVDGLTCP